MFFPYNLIRGCILELEKDLIWSCFLFLPLNSIIILTLRWSDDMSKKKKALRGAYYIMATLLFTGFVIQLYGLVKHFQQTPNNWIGTIMFLMTALVCAFAGVLYFFKAKNYKTD